MATTIPRLFPQRSLDPGGVVQYPTGSPVGAALEQAGTKGQSLVSHYFDRVNQQERFQSLVGFDQFSNSMAGEAETAKQNMQPGAMGLHDQLLETYDKKSDEWLATIPESQRPEFAARIKAKRETFSLGAAKLESAESQRYQGDNISQRIETGRQGVLQGGPSQIDPFANDIEEMIASSTLTPVQKDTLRKTVRPTLEAAGFLSLPPEEKMRVAKGWGLGTELSGTAIDRTMQVLRDKEGFKTSTYWDVNANRVGYGSDTITMPDGTVRQVKAGDTVTRADAERDLQRRTTETLGKVQDQVGADAFARLNPNQQAALGSVAYNYGSLPASVVSAAKSGDTEALARSIEGLQGQNGGVNRNRRLSEAALVRSSGDGPVTGFYAADPRFDNIPSDQRLSLAGRAALEVRQQTAQEAANITAEQKGRMNALETAIIDGKATMADVQKAREDGWLNDAGDIRKLQNQIETRDKKISDLTNWGLASATAGFPWNPLDKQHKAMAEAGFASLGANMDALQAVADKTGIVPATAATAMRGALESPDPRRVENALQTAANLVGGRYPNIFAGAEGGKELTDAAITFRHLIYDRGMTAADATRKMMDERSPDYQNKVKIKFKDEDINEIVKKKLSVDDIRSAFDPSFLGLAPNPKLAFDPSTRQRALGDYEEAFRDYFKQNGDVDQSKKLALAELKRTWGVTRVNGSNVVMKYPPEASPVYQGIENVGEHIASQVQAAVKEWSGADVERKNLRLDEIKQTPERFVSGNPPVYSLSYTDKNGNVQIIPRQFYADPVMMRDRQQAQRADAAKKIMDRVASENDPNTMLATEQNARRVLQLQ